MSLVGEIQVKADALRHNIVALKKLIVPTTHVVAVVKGNAYGHGMAEVVSILEPHADAFQVDDIDELRELRRLTKKRALVFGYVPKEDIEEAVKLGCELVVYDQERLGDIVRAGQTFGVRPKIHLKIDCLLGRQGVLPAQLDELVDAIKERREIEMVAACAHYANIEDSDNPGHAEEQENVFEDCFARVKSAFPRAGRHLSATSGLMAREKQESKNTLIRLGIGVYGLYPSEPLAESHAALALQPVMRWTSILAQVKTMPGGHPIGYGLTYVTPFEMPIGIVPQGYADGYDRGLSNKGEVLVRSERCKVIGRVAMNMFAIDLSKVPFACAEEEVVLLGDQGKERITAEEIAAKSATINYEVITRVSPLLKRKLV